MTWNPGPPYDPRSSPPHPHYDPRSSPPHSRPMGSPSERPAWPPHAHPSRHGPPGASPQHHAHRHAHHGPPPPYRYAQPPRHSPPPPPHHDHGRYDYYHRGSSYPPAAYSTHQRPHYGPTPTARHYDSPESRASPPPRDLRASPPPTCSPIDAFRTGGCTCKKSRCLKLYCQCFALSSTCGPKCKCQACQNTTLHADAIEDARKTILERNPSAFDDKFKTPSNSGLLVSAPSLPTPTPYRYSPPTTAAPAPTPYYPPQSPATYQSPQPPTKSTSTLTSSSSTASPPPPPRVNKFGCKCRRSFCLKKYCECYQNSVHCGLNCRCTNCKNYPKDSEDPEVSPSGTTVPALSSPLSLAKESRAVATESVPCKQAEESLGQDRMAIMAAVAMTELLANAPPRRVSISESAEETKRKAEEMSAEEPFPEHSIPLKKRKAFFFPQPKSTSPERTMMESRNPSPVSTLTPPMYHPMPPPLLHHQQRQQLQQRHHAHHHPHHRPHRAPYSYYAPPPPLRASPTYEDVIRSSGLPKSLSFRKICSKCGKTRGEHGELGFGNKCVYQECGKCGAGVQMHLKAGSPMGILCCLTESEGAIPGATATYDRKIRDLAARAEVQKTLADDKRERAERLALTYP